MSISVPFDLTGCRRFFAEPATPRQRQYEALRAFFMEGLASAEVARRFGYSPAAFRMLCYDFRRGELADFFALTRPGPREQPKKSLAREQVVALRKRNYSIYDISKALKQQGTPLSATAVREILAEQGFPPLPRRLDEDRPASVGPTTEAVADVRSFMLGPREFTTRVGGLFLFVPDLIRLDSDALAATAKLPGSRMIPAGHALRAALALKLWSIQRKSHVMALVADEGLALFCGLNAMPKKSFMAEFSSRITPRKVSHLLAGWHTQLVGETDPRGRILQPRLPLRALLRRAPLVESHYLSKRSRRQPSILTFLAQDADSQVFCYSNADIRKGEEAEEIFRFIKFWTRQYGSPPQHLVFDSKLTTYEQLDRLDQEGITFLTFPPPPANLIPTIDDLPPSASPPINYRQFFIKDLGHDLPTILLTNDKKSTMRQLILRYAKRMLIENALADAVRFFHIDALSSSVGFKVDFDMALLVLASGLYRIMARRMRGYDDAQARQIFRDLIDMPADVAITDHQVSVRFHPPVRLPPLRSSLPPHTTPL